MSTPPAQPVAAPDVFRRIRQQADTLAPELQRAARWVADHPSETGLLSMRQQALSAGVSAPTMVRLARALGFEDYAALRRPFQDAMAGRTLDFGSRASALQAAPDATRAGRLMQELPSGSMLSVPLPEAELRPLLAGGLALAAVNTPSLCVASGEREEIQALAAYFAAQPGLFTVHYSKK